MFYGTFLTWDANTSNTMIGYMKDLFTDLTPLLVVIFGIGVGLIIVGAVIRAIRG